MKYSNIGGQAVMEGVMMRSGDRYAVAVRTADQKIVVGKQDYHPLIPAAKVAKIPILRGVVSFIDSLVLGMKTLMYSADFFAEETSGELEERLAKEAEKAEKKADRLHRAGHPDKASALLAQTSEKAQKERERVKKRGQSDTPKEQKKEDNSLLMGFTVAFSLILSIGLFMMLPYFMSRGLRLWIHSEAVISVLEACLRMVIFFGYLFLISRMKDIQRTFAYHGAEHKCINCIEHGLELNVENVRASSREHKRCGTSFLLYVMVVSVIFYLFIRVDSPLWRIVIRLLLLPVIAGVSYEFIRLAGRCDNAFVNVMSKPGMLLQHLTTREPDDEQIQVGIASVEAIFDWKTYLNENFGAHYPAAQSGENAAQRGEMAAQDNKKRRGDSQAEAAAEQRQQEREGRVS